MKIRHSRRWLPVLLLASCSLAGMPALAQAEEVKRAVTAAETGVPAWDITSADLVADPSVRFGVLPNGMRYAIKRHNNPKGAASLRLAVRVGMKDETDEQHGAAHFVEHMAFNGSKNIPEGQLLPMLERLGLAFGADTNAETDIGHTIYKLDLPNTGTETLDAGLTMLREVAGNLTIAPAAVDRERGVLMSEASLRNDQARRRTASLLTALLPGNRLGERISASSERIKTMTAAELRAFYEAYYRPERTTLAIVGAVDPAEVERRIQSVFGSWKASGKAGEDYRGPVAEAASARTATFTDPAIPELISFERARAWAPQNSEAERKDEMLQAMAGTILANRFWPISQKPDTPALGAMFMPMELGRNVRNSSFFVVAREGKWQEALAVGEQELRRATTHGFTQAEVDEVKQETLATLNGMVEQGGSRMNAAIADGLAKSSLNNQVTTSPEFDLAAFRRVEDSITPGAVTAAFRALWQDGPTLLHLSTKAPVADSSAVIARALASSREVAVMPPVEKALAAFAYESFGPRGKIAAESTDRASGIRRVRFANGIQVNLKPTRWQTGNLAVRMEVGQGIQAFPTDKPGLDFMAALLLPIDGLKAHDAVELRKILAGRSYSLAIVPVRNALVSEAVVSSGELRLQLQLMAARLSATGFRSETKSQWEPLAKILNDTFSAQPGQMLEIARGQILASGDARLGLSDFGELPSRTFEEMQAAIKPQLQTGAVSISLVGDFDTDSALSDLADTLGALPKRIERKPEKYAFAPVAFRGGGLVELTHTGQPDQGAISLTWPTTDSRDYRSSLTRELLAAAMAIRGIDLVRERLGATYAPAAISYDQLTYPDFGHLSLTAQSHPRDMARISEAFRTIAAEFRDKPIDPDLLKRAREPILAAEARDGRDNAKWATYAVSLQSQPELLARWRSRGELFSAITPAEIQAAAQLWLDDAKAVEIRVVPKAVPSKPQP